MKIEYEVLSDLYSVRLPELTRDEHALMVFTPYDIPEILIMPGDDALIPTGLAFGGDYIINVLNHIYVNKESDVVEKYAGTLSAKYPLLHMSVVIDSGCQLFIHFINLGKTEMIVRPGRLIGYLVFSPVTKIELSAEET